MGGKNVADIFVVGFQNASTAVGGPVADCGWVGVLPAANRLLYLRQTLLPPPDQLQGEQKVLPLFTYINGVNCVNIDILSQVPSCENIFSY